MKYYILSSMLSMLTLSAWSQEVKKVTFLGQARGLYYGDALEQDLVVPDTVTIPKLNSGHVMVDLGVSIRPNTNTEIIGMVRVRNDYGGFWGSGVTFDVRQLSVKGVIGGVVRYQLGDINYRMSRYTMWNYDQEVVSGLPSAFQQQTDVVNYDHFLFNDHARRQQGAAAEFGLVFKKWVKELQFHGMTSRVRSSDFSATNDRLFSGIQLNLIQSKYLALGLNYANLYDVPGTSRNKSTFHNPVLTYTWLAQYQTKDLKFKLEGEAGTSRTYYKDNTEAPDWNDGFREATASVGLINWGFGLEGRAFRVGSAFRSPGAQTKRIDFSGLPLAYTRLDNTQEVRTINSLDLMRESDLYNMQIRPYLMAFNPAYDNITPYGDATPNRQGMDVKLKYERKEMPVKVTVGWMNAQEVKGEGTLNLRQFNRTHVQVDVEPNKFVTAWKRNSHIGVRWMQDETSREGEELVQGVDLSTTSLSIGAEFETFKALDVMFGWRKLEYQGFDYTAVRDTYSTIFNFVEYRTDGTETMSSIGLRYRFSEKTFLSAHFNNYHIEDVYGVVERYDIQQIMLLFQMNF